MTTPKSEPKKTWQRYHSIVKGVPVNKYNFSKYLRRVGDFVVTHPMSVEDRTKMRKAAHYWALKHKCTVSCNAEYGGGGRCLRVTVTKAYR